MVDITNVQTDVSKSLNKILADIHILIVKLHNYHWNVSGMQFHAIHNATEAYYDHFFGQYDEVAERVLQIGAKPVSTVKGYLELATISEDEGTKFDAVYVLENIVADFGALRGSCVDALELADSDGDTGTQDLLTGLISWLEKEIWILKSSLGQ